MKEKKNIDRLFQEQLKDFEATPDNQVWLRIEAELKKETKRKVIPIWFKYSGIAAALILGLFLLNTFVISDSKTKNGIVLDTEISEDSINQPVVPFQKNLKQEPIATRSEEVSTVKKEIINRNHSKSVTKNEKEITPFNSTKASEQKNQNGTNLYLSKNHSPIKQLATTENANSNSSIGDKTNVENSSLLEDNSNQTTEKKLADVSDEPKIQIEITPKTPNELEEILKNKENNKDAIATVTKNKWQIIPNVAPVYLNANSGGSPIDSQLSENDKKSENSISYGIGVQYAVNNKIVLRTGINKVVLGYNTNNVLYSAGLATNNLANISYASNNAIEFKNAGYYNALTTSEKSIQNTTTGTLNQKMGYYELPFELSYAVLDKKFGINIIGGLSTLILNENSISLESSTSNIELGEAKNLSKVHLSTNLGLGFKYQLVKSFQLHFEPILKYQFNTFSQESNNFKPAFIGLYTGVSYQF